MEAKSTLWGQGESKMNCSHGSMDEFCAMAEAGEQERDVNQNEAAVISLMITRCQIVYKISNSMVRLQQSD